MNLQSRWMAAPLVVAAAFGIRQGTDSALQKRVEALEDRLEHVESYLQTQAKAASTLSKQLDDSEAEGFTYGINPKSRKILLEAMREAADASQAKVPGAPQASDESADSKSQ